jgi:cytochrome c553
MIRFLPLKFIVFAVVSTLANPILAENSSDDPVAAGKAHFETCAGCHAIPGYTHAYPTYHVPRLGGQHPDYVVTALKSYKNGERLNQTMQANVAHLSEQDMRNIAVYLESFRPVLKEKTNNIQGNIDAGRSKSASCAACHGPDGNSRIALYPRLAGQYEDYLYQSLQDYKTGKRNNPIMRGMSTSLSDQDISDLAAYFASQPMGLVVVQH